MDGVGIARTAHLGHRVGVTKDARDARQRLEMIRAGTFRRQQQEDKIDGLVVQRLEIDRRFEAGENARDALHPGELAVRDGDAVADARRAQPFALQHGVENLALGDAGNRCGPLGEKLKKLLLGVRLERRHDRRHIDEIVRRHKDRNLRMIGVSVPGLTDSTRESLVFAPNLDWRNVAIAEELAIDGVRVVVENDSTAAAMYEARMKIRNSEEGLMTNFILVRSGTGIGVGLVLGSEVYRGSGQTRGIAGEFGHMTIVAGGKQCVCGNRGCWEKYASAAAAASLYLGDRRLRPGETVPRFVEIVAKAENGDNRSRRTLEMIGDYLGIGIANVIMGIGIPRVIISGRLVYGWQFIEQPLRDAIDRSIVGKTEGWSVEAGSPAGAAIGGALEVAVEEYLATV